MGPKKKKIKYQSSPELSTAALFSTTSTTAGRISSIKEEDPTTTSNNFDFNSNAWPDLKDGVNVDASTRNETNQPIKHELPATTSSATPSQDGLSTEKLPFVPSEPPQDSSKAANADGSPPDDGITGTLPSSSADKDSLREDVDASSTNGTSPPIRQEHPATTSNGMPPQDSSRAASLSANTGGSLLDDGINGTLPSSSSSAGKASSKEDVDAHKDNVDASAASATKGIIPPTKQEHPDTASNCTPPQDSSTSANIDGTLLDDKINGSLPSSSSADKASSKEDVDAHIDNIDANNGGEEGDANNGGEEGAASPLGSPEWYPQDDGILSPSSSREDFDANVNRTLYNPLKKERLEVFKTRFPE